MLKYLAKVLSIISITLICILVFALSVFYIYTVYIYFTEYGFWQGFLSMCLPMLSTIWLCIQKWIEEGFNNTITLLGFGSVAVALALYALANFVVYLSEKEDKN